MKEAGSVDISATTNSGHTPVHSACQFGHLDMLRALKSWDVDLSATDNQGRNAAHYAARAHHLDVLTQLKHWNVDLNAVTNQGYTPLKVAVDFRPHLPTAQHLILLGAQVRPADFPASRIDIRRQLMAWADDHLARHRVFVYAVLAAVHDDGSHTAEGQTNWLAHLAGLREMRVRVSEYLGIRVGAEHAALAAASVVFRQMCN